MNQYLIFLFLISGIITWMVLILYATIGWIEKIKYKKSSKIVISYCPECDLNTLHTISNRIKKNMWSICHECSSNRYKKTKK